MRKQYHTVGKRYRTLRKQYHTVGKRYRTLRKRFSTLNLFLYCKYPLKPGPRASCGASARSLFRGPAGRQCQRVILSRPGATISTNTSGSPTYRPEGPALPACFASCCTFLGASGPARRTGAGGRVWAAAKAQRRGVRQGGRRGARHGPAAQTAHRRPRPVRVPLLM